MTMSIDKAILLVEDNLVNQKLAQKILALLGYKVKTVSDGQEAVLLYQKCYEAFVLILMDGEMPVLNGFEATKEVRQWEKLNNYPPIPIIAWTASYGLRENQQKWIAVGVNDFLSKPFRIDEVKRVLSRWLSGGEIQQSTSLLTKVQDPNLQTDQSKLETAAIQQLLLLQKNSPGLIKRLIIKYEQQGSELLQQLILCHQQENQQGIRKAAHTLKSSSAGLGALALASACEHIEQNPADFEAIEKQLQELSVLFKQALYGLDQLQV